MILAVHDPRGRSLPRLTALLAAVVDLPDEATVLRTTLEHVAAALEARGVALVFAGQVTASTGSAPPAQLVQAAGAHDEVEVDGAPATVLRTTCRGLPGAVLVAVRAGRVGFCPDEQELLDGMARVLALAVQARRLVDVHRVQREASDARVVDHAELLVSLSERQVLLERLSRIQRSISSRQPLHEVLDTIVAGAAELLREDIVGLRLLDLEDPGVMVLASSRGVPAHLAASTVRQPVGQGIGGRAIVDNALVHTSSYPAVDTPIPGFSADGILSAMAAPVRQGGRAIGSLVVATRRAGRSYSVSEQEVLTAFAEHVSLALNDAQSVAALHAAVAEATRQSQHDSLTGLPNRAMFLAELQQAESAGEPLTLLFVDLDDFKLVNDSLGHLVGDQLLTAVGHRIGQGLRTPDVVARLGGDEFAVLLRWAGEAEGRAIAARVLDALQEPILLGGHVVHVRASIGLVCSGGGGGSPPEELLRDADVAMYRAKAEGKHRFVVFEGAMRDRLQARTVLQGELHSALSRDQLRLHYQPVLDARAGRVASTEALLRWEHPRLGLVPPADFVPLAEETGLIVGIGAAVLLEACRQTARWRERPELADLSVSVNLSPRQLREEGLVADVRTALRASGLPAHALVLEITESLLVDDVVAATARLDALKALGVRIAVDDFGTGYSSLAYLSRLPVDVLKVDRSFVAGIGQEPAGKLAWAVLALAESLGLSTVAEGVETQAQADALVAQGCTMLQGYLFSAPVPAALLPTVAAGIAAAWSAPTQARSERLPVGRGEDGRTPLRASGAT